MGGRGVFFVPDRIGVDLRLEFLLFKNESKSVYRNLHLWVDVTDG